MTKRCDFPATAEGVAEMVKSLRAPDGCPWDKVQTLESLRESLTGECAEVIEAIDLGDRANLCEELGDLLMNVVFAAVVAEEENSFTWRDVCKNVIAKMVRRHPHVFGEARAESVDDVMRIWGKAKKQEKTPSGAASIYDKPIVSLSALDRATTVQKRAAKVGFDWPDQTGVMEKIGEETRELAEALAEGDEAHIDEELGDLLFSAVNLARFRGGRSAEELLRSSCRKFVKRFQTVEKLAARDGRQAADCTAAELEEYYRNAKKMQI